MAVLWAFDFAGKSVRRLEERYPGKERPGRALQAARDRAAAKVKMPLEHGAAGDFGLPRKPAMGHLMLEVAHFCCG
ncbi:MAG: hypothetical protein MR004_05870 [Clostridiales bacterium]|nr:hypothetical protein [Clostridiales bacterium]MDY4037514.1 hypothetical protein [Candidatus Pseudoscilispira sp.]